MITNREELNQKATAALTLYNVGATLKRASRREINKLLGVHLETPLESDLLYGPVPPYVYEEPFNKLRDLYEQGIHLTIEGQENMLQIWDSELKRIIKTEFAPYSKYENDLYQEGVVGILISMHTDYPEVYEYYYQQIVTEMKTFLAKKGLTYDHQ